MNPEMNWQMLGYSSEEEYQVSGGGEILKTKKSKKCKKNLYYIQNPEL